VPYVTVRRLARGGMGVVDLARDDAGREVARKRVALYGTAEEVEGARRRIRREAEVLAALDHPGIVPLLAVEDEGDDVVLVMPYLPGGTLAERVAAHGPLPLEAVGDLAADLLDALAAAHRLGVVHRDIKPSNVLFAADGRALLSDFGVATWRDATAGLTITGSVVGTPGFMSPEQARGEPATAASDVFSLGATLLYAITGEGPFGDADAAVLMWRAAQGRVAPVPRVVPPALRGPLERMLDRNPVRRPTAAAVRGGVGGTRPRTAVRRLVHPRPERRFAPRKRWLALLAVPLLAAIVAFGLTGRHPQKAAAKPAPSKPLPCAPLAYQPCGQPVAPFTDGRGCTLSHADYDGIAANGCEASPDAVDGSPLVHVLRANLVPDGDVDSYPLAVEDKFQLLCDGTVRVTLTAPRGVAQRLELLDGSGTVVGRAASADGQPATATVSDPSCFRDDSGTLHARVSTVSGHSAAEYRLAVAGSY
jgi:hypothetical protein